LGHEEESVTLSPLPPSALELLEKRISILEEKEKKRKEKKKKEKEQREKELPTHCPDANKPWAIYPKAQVDFAKKFPELLIQTVKMEDPFKKLWEFSQTPEEQAKIVQTTFSDEEENTTIGLASLID